MNHLVEIKKDRIFTLAEAQELLPIVRRITEDTVGQADHLQNRIEALANEPSHHAYYEKELAEIVDRWTQKLVKLGCTPKGLWLVDFNNGQGYYCWSYPEESLGYFHGYDEGFKGRMPIV